MSGALISVVIPTIGRESLARALASVRRQSYACVEIVVALDRPKEAAVVSALMVHGEKLVLTPGACGGAVTRNVGLSATSGQFVAYLDDDDWWDQRKLQMQFDGLENSGAGWSWTYTNFCAGNKRVVLPRRSRLADESAASYLVARSGLRHGDGYIQSSSLLLRRDLAMRVQWDADLPKHQDWDLVARLDAEPVAYDCVGVPLVYVTKQPSGLASVSKTRRWRASAYWYELHGSELSARSSGDFVCTQILRSSLAEGSLRGVLIALKLLGNGVPHGAALTVGLFGAIELVRAWLTTPIALFRTFHSRGGNAVSE